MLTYQQGNCFDFFDSVSDYPLELKGSPDGLESVTSAYINMRDDDARHIPHPSSNIFFFYYLVSMRYYNLHSLDNFITNSLKHLLKKIINIFLLIQLNIFTTS